MDLKTAAEDFEAAFTVCEELGLPIGEYAGPRDMSRAPCGDRYVSLTSSGVLNSPNATVRIWFEDPEDAIRAWLDEARSYASEHAEATYLYWYDRPRLINTDFVNIDQARALRDGLRNTLAVELHFVLSRLVLSVKDPAGKVKQPEGFSP